MDDSTLQSVFWNHLVYPELAVGEVADATVTEKWIRERLPNGRWPEYVVCLAVDGLETAESEARLATVDGIRTVVEERLGASQRTLFGFAHTNAVYFCGCFDSNRTGFIKSLESLQQAMKTGLGISSSIGVAFLPEPTLEGFRWAAQYANVAQRRKVRLGLDRVFVWDTTISPAPIDLGEYWTLARRMQAVIRTGDVLETEMALEDITRALFEDRYLSLLHLRPILQVQVIFMAQAAGEVGADAESVALKARSSPQIGRLTTKPASDFCRAVFAAGGNASKAAKVISRTRIHQNISRSSSLASSVPGRRSRARQPDLEARQGYRHNEVNQPQAYRASEAVTPRPAKQHLLHCL